MMWKAGQKPGPGSSNGDGPNKKLCPELKSRAKFFMVYMNHYYRFRTEDAERED